MEFYTNEMLIFLPGWLLDSAGYLMAFLITFYSIPSIVSLARNKGLYDMPNGRTSHTHATPYLGGVAVFTGLILTTVVIAGIGFGKEFSFIIAGLIILLFVGLTDDMLMIDPYKKLIGQCIAAVIIIVFADIRISNFHTVLDIEEIPYFASIIFSIFVFLVIINGINLIDGIDGLSSGVGIIISTTFGIWFLLTGYIPYSIMSFALAGSLSGFFYFNVFSKKNKIFLGDAGSLMIGLIIAVLTICFLEFQLVTPNYSFQSAPAIAFGILIIPLFDTLRVFILRLSQKRSPFSADRQHIHHVLIDLDMSHLKATIILMSLNVLFIIISLIFHNLRNLYLISLQIIFAACFSYIAIYLLKMKRRSDLNGKHNLRYAKEVSISNNPTSNKNLDDSENLKSKRKFPIIKILNV